MDNSKPAVAGSAPIAFVENAIYTLAQASNILQLHQQTVRRLCRDGLIVARAERGGYRISGWALRAYSENRCICTENP